MTRDGGARSCREAQKGGAKGGAKPAGGPYGCFLLWIIMPPQPRAIFRKISIASGEILEVTLSCSTFIISVTSASSSLRNRQVAPLMPGPETPRWGRPLQSSIRPRLAKFSGF